MRATVVDFSWINSIKKCNFEADLLMKYNLFLDVEDARANE